MDTSFPFSLRQLVTNPALSVTVLLTLGVICVNGITDAPNTVAICVSTRSLNVSLVITMAAVCSCARAVVVTVVNSTATMTITNTTNFGEDTSIALVTLCAALFFIMVWSSFAVSIGCPTSESHALVADLTGTAVATRRGLSAINSAGWIGVVYGLIFSVVLGFLSGYLSCRLVAWTCRDTDRRETIEFFRYARIGGAAAMALMYGAQDGQKFMGVMPLDIRMVNGSSNTRGARSPLRMLSLGSATMAPGTSIGGREIIKSVGMDTVRLEKYQDFSMDTAGVARLLGFSIFGIPASTTHTRTTAIMDVGAARHLPAINFGVVKGMVITWVMTFPGCGIIGFLMAKLFMMLFHG